MIRVRATQDGTYDKHYWEGPMDFVGGAGQGHKPGDVFDVDEKPYQVKDEQGRPMMEPILDDLGMPKKDKNGTVLTRQKMATFFSPSWMERVDDNTELTYPDREPGKIPDFYREKKQNPSKPLALPADVAALTQSPI